jgi:hypothetical protein
MWNSKCLVRLNALNINQGVAPLRGRKELLMESKILFQRLNLQLFAEGGGGDGGTSAGGEMGVTEGAANPQGQVQVTDADGNTAQNIDRQAEFDKLIKGEYKDLYDAKMQDTIQKRLKGTKETVEKYEALSPTLEMLSKKYGVDAGDIDALNKAIEEDDSYYEDEALEKGISVQQLKEIRKMEKENANLKKQMQEQAAKENAHKLYASWMDQGEQTKAVYPHFDFETEMQNPKFLELLRSVSCKEYRSGCKFCGIAGFIQDFCLYWGKLFPFRIEVCGVHLHPAGINHRDNEKITLSGVEIVVQGHLGNGGQGTN